MPDEPLYHVDAAGTRWRVLDSVQVAPGNVGPPVVPAVMTRHNPPHPAASSRWFVREDRVVRIASIVWPAERGVDAENLERQLRGAAWYYEHARPGAVRAARTGGGIGGDR